MIILFVYGVLLRLFKNLINKFNVNDIFLFDF